MNEKQTIPASQVQVKDVMAFVYFGEVVDKRSDNYISVRNLDNGGTFNVDGRELIEDSFSADRYVKEQKVTKTEAAEILINAYNTPFTVVFEKADGSPRKLRGRLIAPEPLLGRSKVEDLDIKTGNNLRQVDHRTISQIICRGIKFIVV